MKTTFDETPQVVASNSPIPMTRDTEGPEHMQHPWAVLEYEHEKQSKSKRLSRWHWIAAIVAAALIGLGVGVGIGYGAFSDSDNRNTQNTATSSPSSSTSSPSSMISTTGAAPTPLTSGVISYTCNDSIVEDAYLYTTPSGVRFHQQCHVGYPGDVDDREDGNGKVQDLHRITVYSFESCMDNCAAYNRCEALTYGANLTLELNLNGANCFMKSARGTGSVDTSYGQEYNLLASAWIIHPMKKA